jgi:hypothetical protein
MRVKSDLMLLFDRLVYQPYFSEFFDHDDHHDHGGSGGGENRKKNPPKADWLALWLSSKSKTRAITLFPEETPPPPHRSSGSYKGEGGAEDSNPERRRSSAAQDVSERLVNLAQLYKEGVLTEEEFTTAKQKVLTA